jgi:tRNA A37 threonylcarbamoyladenosine dehydratase
MANETYKRSLSLLGTEAFERLQSSRVAIFGLGGVGGWCAEALLRTGVKHLTIVDDDIVAESNTNRQRQANPSTIGRLKAEVLKEMLLEAIPDADICAISKRYTPESSEDFTSVLSRCDVVIDAIDSVDCKAHLIQNCLSASDRRPALFSSMGAALRTDPTKICTAPFHKVAGDGLAKALRNRFRKSSIPLPKHLCVYSQELPSIALDSVKGSIMPVTCAFGMALAALAIKEITA